MSILIRNMEMPKSRGVFVYVGVDGTAIVQDDVVKITTAIEVPTPHGRLIDADALRVLYEKWHDDELMGFDFDTCVVPIPVIRQNIDDAPTIIESEGLDGRNNKG